MEFEKIHKPQDSSFRCFIRENEKFKFCWHYHPECELTLILSGTGKRYVGDNISDYQKGDLVILGSNLPHSWKSASASSKKTSCDKAVVIQFSKEFLGNSFFEHPEMTNIRHTLDESSWGIRFVFNDPESIHKKIAALVDLTGFRRLVTFLEVLDLLSRSPNRQNLSTRFFAEPRNHVEQKRIQSIFNLIHQHYTKEISLTQIASMVHMSPSNFSRYFKKITGRSFISYLNDIKTSRACELLASTNKSVTQICFECGFNNLSNFNRQFLRKKGVPPRQYRKLFFTNEVSG